jgi:cyclophilin family peptidyl-prolyl cis-trans isomerase/HEAT repeat protein
VTPRALLLLALAAPACGAPTPPLFPGPERERTVLSGQDVDRLARLLRFEDHRSYDPGAFERLAADLGAEIRRRTAVAAGRTGDPAAAALLIGLLGRDPSGAVRADAAFALGVLGDTSAAVVAALRRAAPREWVPVRPEETAVVVEIVTALGRIGTDAARAEVVDVLRRVQRAEDAIARRVAAEALLAVWRFPAGPGRTVSVLRFLDHPDPELRWRAALALTRLRDPDGAARLIPMLGDPDPRVRALAARALPAQVADPAGVTGEVVAGLTAALEDPGPAVRIQALRSLATFADRAPGDAIAARLRDLDPGVAVTAADALGVIRVGSHALEAVLADETAPVAVRAAALGTLAALAPAAALAAAEAWAEGDFPHRYAAARATGALGWPDAQGLLDRLTGDADPRVAVAATEAAAALAASPNLGPDERAGLRRLLLRAVAADDPRQRVPALRGVGPLLGPEDLPAMLAAYEAAVRDPAARPAAIAAVRALAAMEAAGTAAAPPFFQRFEPPADRWIHRAVADALGPGWGPAPAPAAADDIDFYHDVVRRLVAPVLAGGRRPEAVIATRRGEIRVELLSEEAPLTVHNFMSLAAAGFYDGGVWHRVVPDFVIQDGAPMGDPSGGPGWTIRDEINRTRYDRGILGMALAGPDTGGSQWFITLSPQPHLDGGYTVFGRVIAGAAVMDQVVQGEPVESVGIRP